jgi:peptidyl-prolyl cis-trans isomerase SurA
MTSRRLRLLATFASLAPFVAHADTQTAPDASTKADQAINLRFANGVVAVAEDKVITVDELRREISPRIPGLQREARNEKEFNTKLEALQDEVIQDMVDRVLIVKEFKKDEKRRVPASFVDNAIAEEQITRFEGDRSKFLAYLRANGLTLREYRRKVEDDLIYQYMRGQQRKNQNVVSPVRVETFYTENKDRFYQDDQVHMRMIALTRKDAATDAALTEKAEAILARLKAGEKFEDLAREFSTDSKRTKGGDWGWQRKTDLKPEFADPLFQLSKGQTTAPILAPEAVYLLHVEDRKVAGLQPLVEVRDQIERILIAQMGRDSEERWIERLRRNGYVRIY